MSELLSKEQQKLLILHEIVKEMKEWPLDMNQMPGYKELVLKQQEMLKDMPGHLLADSIRNAGEQVTFSFSFLKSPPFPLSKGIQRVLIDELDDDGIVYYYDPLYKPFKTYDKSKSKLQVFPNNGNNDVNDYFERKQSDLMALPSIEITANREVVIKKYEELLAKYPDIIIPEREKTELEKKMENSPANPLWKDGNKFRYYLKEVEMRPQVFRLCDFLVKHYGKYYSLDQLSSIIDKDGDGTNISKDNIYTCCSELRKALWQHFEKDVIQDKKKEGMYRIFVE